jgi:predicted nucleic acid-binding protein
VASNKHRYKLQIDISDTSTLILFHKIEEFNLLQKVYGELITTPEIAEYY